MCFKDPALYVFDFDGLHRGSLCFLKTAPCKRAELPYISIFKFFPCCIYEQMGEEIFLTMFDKPTVSQEATIQK